MLPRIHYPAGGYGDTTANGDEASGETATESDWWANAIEEDSFMSPFPFDASENGLWNGRFVPPPPRPPFLDDSVASDGLTTCDLCTWAWRDRNAFSLDGTIAETAGELGWTFSLIIVSGLSALLGAIIMISVIKCKRSSSNSNGSRSDPWWTCSNRSNTATSRLDALTKPQTDSLREGPIEGTTNSGVRTWLTKTNRRQPAIPNQLDSPTHPSVGNHYSHMDDSYSPTDVGEALYSELDRESIRSDNPFSTYNQNNTYSRCVEPYQDMPVIVSSAPSSAYYSDMSNTERAYEVVDLTVMSSSIPNWNKNAPNTMPPKNRALEVSETTRLHKDTSAAGHMTTRACMEQNRLQLQNKNYSKQKPDSAFGDSFS